MNRNKALSLRELLREYRGTKVPPFLIPQSLFFLRPPAVPCGGEPRRKLRFPLLLEHAARLPNHRAGGTGRKLRLGYISRSDPLQHLKVPHDR